jgi:hypothetical protein
MLFSFQRITNYAFNPIKNSGNSFGYDLKIPYDYLIKKKSGMTIQLYLKFIFSENCYGLITPILTLSRDYFLCVLNGKQNNQLVDIYLKFFYYSNNLGMIENENIGNTSITIFNHGKRDFKIKRGDHVLKLIIGKNVDSIPYELEQQLNVEEIIQSKNKKVCTKTIKSEPKRKANIQSTSEQSKGLITVGQPEISTNNAATTIAKPSSSGVSYDNLEIKPQNREISLPDELLDDPYIFSTEIFSFSPNELQDLSKMDLFKDLI